MNLQPINPYTIIETLNDKVKELSNVNGAIMTSIKDAQITKVSKNGIDMTATIHLNDKTSQDVDITIKKKSGKGSLEVFEAVAEQLRFLKAFSLETMESMKNDSMD